MVVPNYLVCVETIHKFENSKIVLKKLETSYLEFSKFDYKLKLRIDIFAIAIVLLNICNIFVAIVFNSFEK